MDYFQKLNHVTYNAVVRLDSLRNDIIIHHIAWTGEHYIILHVLNITKNQYIYLVLCAFIVYLVDTENTFYSMCISSLPIFK